MQSRMRASIWFSADGCPFWEVDGSFPFPSSCLPSFPSFPFLPQLSFSPFHIYPLSSTSPAFLIISHRPSLNFNSSHSITSTMKSFSPVVIALLATASIVFASGMSASQCSVCSRLLDPCWPHLLNRLTQTHSKCASPT